MVLVAGVSLFDGLASGVDVAVDRLPSPLHAYVNGPDLLSSRIEPDRLVGADIPYLALRVRTGRLQTNGLDWTVVVAALSTHAAGDPTGTTAYPPRSDDLSLDTDLAAAIEASSGRFLDPTGNLSLLGANLTGLALVAPPPGRPAFLPSAWAWVRPELLVAMSPTEGGHVQALVTDVPLDPGVAADLGLQRLESVGAVGFLRGSIDQASRALAVLVGVIVVVVALLAYVGLSLEVHQRSQEICTLRHLGASPRSVAFLYEGQALTLGLLGATAGSALGILVAHGIVSFAPLIGLPNLVILSPPLTGVALAYIVAVLASVVGGVVPSRRAASFVRPLQEAGRS
jgi:hypothetical protein